MPTPADALGGRSAAPPRTRPFGGAGGMAAGLALATREWVRFFRQRHRVVAAVATPLLLWLLLGLGLRDAFVPGAAAVEGGGAAGSLAFYYPGAVVLTVLFTSIFTCISVIEDRQEGFLQGVLASRAPRWSVAAGKVLGGAAIAVAQGLALIGLGLLVFPAPSPAGLAAAVAALVVLSVMLTALGLCFAWPMRSTSGYHGVMNLVLMPMWLLSGGLFPASTAAPPLQWAMRLNPLAHGHELFAAGFAGVRPALASPATSWAVVLATTAGLLVIATARVTRPVREDAT
ncbi:putative ABC transporter permease protein [Phycisphaera mikurensis NBRC 102666]|uniref:Transport permease protein n=1 Tax=Phycisphaera mikurensis (strain NBRC 102666 / KCTC 22515 / FYK2301M01) TaxID=1142394 RepID=I0IHU6_PHYMF|nr:putative ABC transporter permease protein [Phycisphaera mikurensis NBRC 102666]